MAMSKEQVKDIKLIFKENDGFIPKIWVRRGFTNGYTSSHAIYIWNIECIQHMKYSLHFVCYLSKFIMKPQCCDPTTREVGVSWTNNLLDTNDGGKILFPRALRLEQFLLENMETVQLINEKLDCIKNKLCADETIFSKLDSIPTSLGNFSSDLCFTCGELRRGTRPCERCLLHNIIIMEIVHRAECWRCLTPWLYISLPMIVNPTKTYMYTIDLRKKLITMGWEKHPDESRPYNLRSDYRDDGIQQNRPLAMMWSAMDVFEMCSARVKIPTLQNFLKFYVLLNCKAEKLDDYLPRYVIEDIESIRKNFKKFTTTPV